MSEVKFYRQCSLLRHIPGGTEHTTSWLPECFAHVGWTLKLKDEKGQWVDGWVVMTASDPLDAKIVEKNSRSYLKQRSASDVIFSKIKEENKAVYRRD
jgi:hypothetical protein